MAREKIGQMVFKVLPLLNACRQWAERGRARAAERVKQKGFSKIETMKAVTPISSTICRTNRIGYGVDRTEQLLRARTLSIDAMEAGRQTSSPPENR